MTLLSTEYFQGMFPQWKSVNKQRKRDGKINCAKEKPVYVQSEFSYFPDIQSKTQKSSSLNKAPLNKRSCKYFLHEVGLGMRMRRMLTYLKVVGSYRILRCPLALRH